MAPFTNCEVAHKRNRVSEVDEQHTTESDVVIDEADDRTCHQPTTPIPPTKKVLLRRTLPRSEFLDQCGDRRPEHQKPAATSVFIK